MTEPLCQHDGIEDASDCPHAIHLPTEADMQAGMPGQVRGLLPPVNPPCGGCHHAAHWRACREPDCYCRRRGPHGDAP